MSINNLCHSYCDFCNYKESKPCLMCNKYIIYLAIKDAWSDKLSSLELENIADRVDHLADKIESLGNDLDGLSTEIYKYRKDQAMKDPNDTRIWVS